MEQKNEVTFIMIAYILMAIVMDERFVQKKKTQIIAHRGASLLAPENTMAAFYKAIEFGVDRIEFDIQLSKDKKLVVIHDYTVDRTTDGKGFVRNHTLRSLKQLNAGSWFNERFHSEKIPTLNEIMKHCLGKVNLLIEIKDPDLYPGIEKILAQKVKSKMNGENIIIQSFHEKSLRLFKEMVPNAPTCLLISGFEFNGLNKDRLKKIAKFVDYISPPESLVTSEFITTTQHLGLKTFAWNVNFLNEYQRLNQLDVDGIVTNIPTISGEANNENSNKGNRLEADKQVQFKGVLSFLTFVTNEIRNVFNSLK